MNHPFRLVTLVLIGCLAGCDNPKPLSELTCEDSPVGRTKEEQTAIADACFRAGSFKKSSGKEW
ncbi:TPA: entry exclusion lipoprotein TrbK [Legionella pneumophila]